MATHDGKMRFGIALQGGGAHWRDPAVAPNAASQIDGYREFARIGEAGKLDFGFIADSAYISEGSPWEFLSRPDPMAALSALVPGTTNLGLVGTLSTSYSYPFTTARQLASLDQISGGRAGWNVVTSAYSDMGQNYGGAALPPHDVRYQIADEYINVCKGLWDSFDDDAFVRDRNSGIYLDYDKMHRLDHIGEYFRVQGPLNMERTPQGYPVIFQAGASDAGRNLAAKHGEVIFASVFEADDASKAVSYAQDVRSRAVGFGRSASDMLVLPAAYPIVGSTESEAVAKYEHQAAYFEIDQALKVLSRYFNFFDFTKFPLDEPLPDISGIASDGFETMTRYYAGVAREESLTLRQLAHRAATPKGSFVGTPKSVADEMQAQFESGAFDGFVLFGTHVHLREFTEQVLPILRKRGLFREEYESETLRGNLGFARPQSRYAMANAKAR